MFPSLTVVEKHPLRMRGLAARPREFSTAPRSDWTYPRADKDGFYNRNPIDECNSDFASQVDVSHRSARDQATSPCLTQMENKHRYRSRMRFGLGSLADAVGAP